MVLCYGVLWLDGVAAAAKGRELEECTVAAAVPISIIELTIHGGLW